MNKEEKEAWVIALIVGAILAFLLPWDIILK